MTMRTVQVTKTFKRRGELILPGSIIEVPETVYPHLVEFVKLLPRQRADSVPEWRSKRKAWIQGGELRTIGVFVDLASEIAKLTKHDYGLQRRLLIEHCDLYAPTHLWIMIEKWEERAAILEFEAGMTKTEAEREAARQYHLLAFQNEIEGRPFR